MSNSTYSFPFLSSSFLFFVVAKPSMDHLALPVAGAAGHLEVDKSAKSKVSWDLTEPGSEDTPLIIASDEDLTGEDEEITGAFSGL